MSVRCWKFVERQFRLLHFRNILHDVILSQMHISALAPKLSQKSSKQTQLTPTPMTSFACSSDTKCELNLFDFGFQSRWRTSERLLVFSPQYPGAQSLSHGRGQAHSLDDGILVKLRG